MTIHKTTSIQTKLSGAQPGATTVKADGRSQEFALDGQLESFVPSTSSGDIRSLQEAAQLVNTPQIQSALSSIRSSGSAGRVVTLEESGSWDVYPMFGSVSISRLNPEDGRRHSVSLYGDRITVKQETKVGEDLVKQTLVGERDQSDGTVTPTEEWLTVESVIVS